jgi:putative membrane protein
VTEPRSSLKARAAGALTLLGPGTALAHGGHAPALSLPEVLGWWTWDPLVLGTLALSAFVYLRGLRTLWRRTGTGRGVQRWEAGAFALGWLTVALALLSPLDRLSDLLFSAHMTQHELLMLAAAPLLVLGRPHLPALWALSPSWRARVVRWMRVRPVRTAWRATTGPFLVLLLHALARWVWHLPVLFQAALESEAVHALQHFMFFSSAELFWWALLRGRYGRVGYGVAVLFVFATAAHTSLLGALLTFARSAWYPLYEGRTEAGGLEALEDQQLAGLIMWVPTGAIFILVGLALFAAWLGEAERRVAHTRVEFSEEVPP